MAASQWQEERDVGDLQAGLFSITAKRAQWLPIGDHQSVILQHYLGGRSEETFGDRLPGGIMSSQIDLSRPNKSVAKLGWRPRMLHDLNPRPCLMVFGWIEILPMRHPRGSGAQPESI